MKTLIIAEKPSVATDLSKVLGKLKKDGDFYESDDMIITSAIGHIVELFMPDDIDKKLKWWSLSTLPIIPEKFQVKPIERTKDRFTLLKKLMARSDVDTIVNACDAGREGELIFTYIYELAKCKKPVKRMWMSSMTPQSIKEAYDKMRTQEEMIPLQQAAKCRSESDWLIGINGTRAITARMFGRKAGQIATVGRVQTPTLTLVVEREKAIKSFVPTPYWRITADFGIKAGEYEGVFQKPNFKKQDDNEHDRADRIWEKAEAERILAEVQKAQHADVTEVTKRSKQSAPLLYDLTTLQREANGRFGFPAGMTLKIAQSLYEKHKMITYPRTDSKALPEDYGNTCVEVLSGFAPKDLREAAGEVLKNKWINTADKRIFNNKKISDHFAIIPTNEKPKKLSDDEAKIYDMIARRFIAVFYPSAEFDVTTRTSVAAGHSFKTEGKVLKVPGWLAVYGKAETSKEHLVPLSKEDGDPAKATINATDLHGEETKPPARFTEATLLSAMEHAGKLVEDSELADAMKEKGLGTPATRAQIIDGLVREKYLMREQRELIPTIKAENLVQFLGILNVEALTSPDMTGEWEFKLKQIENGELSREDFMAGIAKMTETIIERTKAYDEGEMETTETDIISPTDNKPMLENFRSYKSQDGLMTIYKTMGNRRFAPEEVKELVQKGQLGPLDDFRSKAGKPFSAMLKIEENKAKFVFGEVDDENRGPDGKLDLSEYQVISECPLAKRGLCSHSSANVYATPSAYICENHGAEGTKCKFKMNRTLLGRAIPEDQFKKLVNDGKTDLLDKFRSNKTKRLFNAHLILKEDGGIGFEFEAKAPKEGAAKKKATKKTTKKTTKKE